VKTCQVMLAEEPPGGAHLPGDAQEDLPGDAG